jgi:hypothetical protein
MTNITTKLESQPAAETAVHLFDSWFDPRLGYGRHVPQRFYPLS